MSKTIGSKEYNEWLNNPLTKALKRSFEQSITDPENQPSQYGTVTLSMYERLEEQLTTAQAQIKVLESDPAIHFAHRFAVVLECMIHSEYPNEFWDEATTLLSEHHEAQDKWREMMGEPYVSGFGKD